MQVGSLDFLGSVYSSSTLFFLAPDGNVVSGLTFKRSIDQKTFFISNNFSACISLKVKRMSSEKSAMLLNIETSEGFWFFKLYARYPATWFHFDDTSWVIKDLWTNSYHIWKINVWHHICFSYSESNSFISLVKVRYIKDYYVDGQNIQLIFFEKNTTRGGKTRLVVWWFEL